MLVLTRRSKDKISFPEVGVTIHFIRVQSGQVKVGVDAPRDIAIIRDEITDEEAAKKLVERQISRLPKAIRHGIRNELHQMSVGLHLYKELVSAGLMDEAADVFQTIQESLGRLDETEALNPPPTDDADPVSKTTTQPEAPPESKPINTVVLVEDQANEREMLASVLRLQNMSVVTCSDGDEAIEYFRNHPAPTYLLMDMMMSGCDGATAIEVLQKGGHLDATQVYALSGLSPETFGVSIGKDGGDVDQWFPKPVNPSVLIEAMN